MKKLINNCIRCGACCKYLNPIALTKADINRIAKYLNITPEKYIMDNTIPNTHPDHDELELWAFKTSPCEFYDDKIGCKIYRIRPRVCINYNLNPKPNYFCIGMGIAMGYTPEKLNDTYIITPPWDD